MAIFLFFGDDTYSLNEKLAFWRSEFEKKYGGDTNVSIFEEKNARANEIFQACSSMPFLAEKRMTIVKNFLSEARDEEKSAMAELVEKIPDFCILVFSETGEIDRRIGIYKKLQKFGKLMEFPAITGSKLLGWIQKKVETAEGTIEKDAVIFLSELVAGDLYRLENEIAKLVGYSASPRGEREVERGSGSASPSEDRAYKTSTRPITKHDIELLVDTQLTANIFRLTDGIGQKNRKLAIETLHQLMDSGEDLHRILYMIMRQFRIITSVKDLSEQGLSRDAITAKLKEHPFVISNTIGQARNFTLEQLKRAYELLIDIDTKLKSGGIKILAGDNREFVLALDRLVLNLSAN